MPVTPPGAPAAATPPVEAVGANDVTVNLFDYLAELQGSPAAGNEAARLANPATLLSEAVQGLEGYAHGIQTVFDGGSSPTVSGSEPATAPQGGPAQEPLDPAQTTTRETGGENMDQVLDRLVSVLWAGTNTTFLVSGTSGLSKAANTLLRGQ